MQLLFPRIQRVPAPSFSHYFHIDMTVETVASFRVTCSFPRQCFCHCQASVVSLGSLGMNAAEKLDGFWAAHRALAAFYEADIARLEADGIDQRCGLYRQSMAKMKTSAGQSTVEACRHMVLFFSCHSRYVLLHLGTLLHISNVAGTWNLQCVQGGCSAGSFPPKHQPPEPSEWGEEGKLLDLSTFQAFNLKLILTYSNYILLFKIPIAWFQFWIPIDSN